MHTRPMVAVEAAAVAEDSSSCFLAVAADVTFGVMVMRHLLESSRLDAEEPDVEVVAETLNSGALDHHVLSDVEAMGHSY